MRLFPGHVLKHERRNRWSKNMSGCWLSITVGRWYRNHCLQFTSRFMKIGFKLVLSNSDYFMFQSSYSPYILLVSLNNIFFHLPFVRRIYFSCCIFNSGLWLYPQILFKPLFNLSEATRQKWTLWGYLWACDHSFYCFYEPIFYYFLRAPSLTQRHWRN